MMRMLCLPGDGIGPEITSAARAVVDASGAAVAWSEAAIGFAALDAVGTTIPDDIIAAARAADGILLGPVSHNLYPPVAAGGKNPSGTLRKALELFANIRPARSYDGVPTPTGATADMVIFRENLEGFYADRNMVSGGSEMMVSPGIAIAIRKITEQGSTRIARAAFDAAASRRRKVVAVHKANVMRTTCGLFLDACRAVAKTCPDIEYSEMLVDAAAAHMVRDPAQFDVIVTTNMFGDILSDLAAELSGGLGLAGSLNLGAAHAVAQAQHGSAPDIAGRNIANPTSMILSASMLLAHLGIREPAARIDRALARCLARPSTRTRDLGGSLGTRAFAKTVIAEMQP